MRRLNGGYWLYSHPYPAVCSPGRRPRWTPVWKAPRPSTVAGCFPAVALPALRNCRARTRDLFLRHPDESPLPADRGPKAASYTNHRTRPKPCTCRMAWSQRINKPRYGHPEPSSPAAGTRLIFSSQRVGVELSGTSAPPSLPVPVAPKKSRMTLVRRKFRATSTRGHGKYNMRAGVFMR